MPATRTATASARCTSTPWRVSGHCSAPGCVRIAASRRRSCQSISASLSSCTTRAGAEKPCSAPLSLPSSGDVLHHPGSRQEPTWLTAVTPDTPGMVKRATASPLWLFPYPLAQQFAPGGTSGRSRAGGRSVKSHNRLGLFHPDGSLTVYPPDIEIEQARREAIDGDENQDNPGHFTKVVSLCAKDIEVLEVPSLKPQKRLI